jgi:hypothetical protein
MTRYPKEQLQWIKDGKALEHEAWKHYCESAEIGISKEIADARLANARILIRAEGQKRMEAYFKK